MGWDFCMEDTVFYKETYAIGYKEGKINGKPVGETRGAIRLLKQFYLDGVITGEIFQSHLAPLEKKLEEEIQQQEKREHKNSSKNDSGLK